MMGTAESRELAKSAQRMKAIRQALGMTQQEWAYFLRVAIGTVSLWERGSRKPSALAERAIRQVCVEHGVDIHTLQPFD